MTEFSLAGYANTRLSDVNDSGLAVGQAWNDTDPVGFVYQNGVATILSNPAGRITSATGVSNSGLIVGSWYDNNQTRSYLLDNGNFSEFAIPGASSTELRHVSSDGRYLTGTYVVGSPDFSSGFAFDRLTSTLIRFASNAVDSSYIVQGANSAGLITGTVYDNAGVRSFVYNMQDGSQSVYKESPNRSGSRFRDINDHGEIVGFFRNSAIVGTPSIGFESFTFAGASSTAVYGNNNRGDMVGYFYTDPSLSTMHSFIAMSVPEPGTQALLLIGLIGLLAGLGRQSKQPSGPAVRQ